MAINFFDRVITKPRGKSNAVVCPVCGKTAELNIFENMDFSTAALFLKKEASEYFAVCPLCASAFSVSRHYMKAKNNGMFCLMTQDDLAVISKGNACE